MIEKTEAIISLLQDVASARPSDVPEEQWRACLSVARSPGGRDEVQRKLLRTFYLLAALELLPALDTAEKRKRFESVILGDAVDTDTLLFKAAVFKVWLEGRRGRGRPRRTSWPSARRAQILRLHELVFTGLQPKTAARQIFQSLGRKTSSETGFADGLVRDWKKFISESRAPSDRISG